MPTVGATTVDCIMEKCGTGDDESHSRPLSKLNGEKYCKKKKVEISEGFIGLFFSQCALDNGPD